MGGEIDGLFLTGDGELVLVDYKRVAPNKPMHANAVDFGGACGLWPLHSVPDTAFHRYSVQVALYALMLWQTHQLDCGDRLYLFCMHRDRVEPVLGPAP